ncbi:MAG TPA: ammonium transporter [Humisphaera sp.]|jgi:Amt family ammonium transporter|nr:ammonium transporter [Humisphaera sp.]
MDPALGGGRLSFGQKLARLGQRMHDPEWRRYARLVFAGKMLGFGALIAVILLINVVPAMMSGTAHAQAATEPATTQAVAAAATPDPYAIAKGGDIINPLNTVWTLVAAFLVFGMQAGFTMLEAGFCRSRETVNVLVECVFDTCLCGFLYYAWGYAFMFGQGNGFIGWHDPNDAAGGPVNSWFFLKGIGAMTLYGTTGVPVLAHWVFQFAFADCASTICSGTMIGRTDFIGDILYSVCVSGFIYPIIGHWAWGPDGFLYTMGGLNASANSFTHFLTGLGMNFHDFAGSTVVHSIGGWIAIAGGIMLGPRIGRKFKRDGGGPMLPHDLVMGVIGGFILWFGWYGFNPGSTLSAMDFGGIARVAANTTLAACTGGMAAELFVYARIKKWDAAAITNGFLAGLVAITCPCYWVSPTGACALGAIAGVIVILGVDLLEYLRIDDPIGAWPVHGLCGIWGTLSLGLFACGYYSAAGSSPTSVPNPVHGSGDALTGLFYGGGFKVLAGQAIGSFIVCAATFTVAMTVFGVLHMMGKLRLSKEGELEGMDLHEHGISAYPEYVISALASPRGMPRDTVGHYTGSTADEEHGTLVGSKK